METITWKVGRYIVNRRSKILHRERPEERCNTDALKVRQFCNRQEALAALGQGWRCCKICLPQGIRLGG